MKIKLVRIMAIHSQSLSKISAKLIKTSQIKRRTMLLMRTYNETRHRHKLRYRRILKRPLPLP